MPPKKIKLHTSEIECEADFSSLLEQLLLLSNISQPFIIDTNTISDARTGVVFSQESNLL